MRLIPIFNYVFKENTVDNLKYTKFQVSSSPTLIPSPGFARDRLILTNNTTLIYFGDFDVSEKKGTVINPGETLDIQNNPILPWDDLYLSTGKEGVLATVDIIEVGWDEVDI